ncbi:hypothetical protein N0V90_000949 [Kalmusia sp. IMI 367209]|nr:hypothetical protein N0V90_000949 [Kalmusia sp. IMI 367209]
MVSTIHPQATSGFRAAGSYDLHRPSYPPSAIDDLLAAIRVKGVAKAQIVEIGAGTGKFTELLASGAEQYRIIAGEPHAQMREILTNKGLKGTTVVADVAERLESVEDGMMSVHVFDPTKIVYGLTRPRFATVTTLEEIRRVLRPNGGGLGFIWNVDDFNAPIKSTPSTPYEARLKDIIRSLPNPTNQYRELKWKECLHPSQQQLFDYPLLERELPWTIVLSRQGIWERFATMTQVSSLDGAELQGDDVIEDAEGNIEFHGRTVWYWTFPSSDR